MPMHAPPHPGEGRQIRVPRAPRTDRNKGSQWARYNPADPVRSCHREVRHLLGDGRPTLQSIRFDTRNVARLTDSIRSMAGTRSNEQNRGRKVRDDEFDLAIGLVPLPAESDIRVIPQPSFRRRPESRVWGGCLYGQNYLETVLGERDLRAQPHGERLESGPQRRRCRKP